MSALDAGTVPVIELVEAIRQVFLSPRPFYTPTQAAVLLGRSTGEIENAIHAGEIEAERICSGFRIAWQEVAVMITAQCSKAAVEQALGNDSSSVLPDLVRLAEFRVEIPRYQTVMLRSLAERDQLSVDELLASHLLDLAGAEIDWLPRSIPGFEAAMRWPER
jgi:excisionase family DNA binding protein